MKNNLLICSILLLIASCGSVNFRESTVYCLALGAPTYLLTKDMTASGVLCGAGAFAQPFVESHYKQKHSDEARRTIMELQNINERHKSLSWIRGEKLGEPQYIIEEKQIDAVQTGTSIRLPTKELKFSLPDSSGVRIGE